VYGGSVREIKVREKQRLADQLAELLAGEKEFPRASIVILGRVVAVVNHFFRLPSRSGKALSFAERKATLAEGKGQRFTSCPRL
jgi:hypothetical protein